MTSYYNENDPYAAQWLRNLIEAGLIAPGVVDERSIAEVSPSDLKGFVQCHFFAGIGVWSLALRRAGWDDTRPVWTGSCPCQPFSIAGKGAGLADERHLWPVFESLIRQCGPAIVLGEQVASSYADAWIDTVQADMEALEYAFAAVPFPSAGIGAPHIRDRTYWLGVALGDAERAGLEGYGRHGNAGQKPGRLDTQPHGSVGAPGAFGGVANAFESERGGRSDDGALFANRHASGRGEIASYAERDSDTGGMANATGKRPNGRGLGIAGDGRDAARLESERLCNAGWMANAGGTRSQAGVSAQGHGEEGHTSFIDHSSSKFGWDTGPLSPTPANAVNGFWADADWLFCRDGKFRPVEPGTFPLVDGTAGRVGRVRADHERITAQVPRKDQGSRKGRLKGYGNALNAEAARVFIESVMQCL